MAAAESTAPPPAPEEKPGGRKALWVLVIVAVIVIAALGIGAVLLLGKPPAPPPTGATLDHVNVAVTGGATTLDQAATASLSATAFDTAGYDETVNASFAWSVAPTGALAISHPGANSSAVVTAVQGGSAKITATATWKAVSKSGTANFTVNALHFYVTGSTAHPVVGTPFVLTVKVARADNTTDTSFLGLVHFTSTDTTATLPADSLFTAADLGVKGFTNVTINHVGAVQITATNTSFSITGSATIYGNSPPVASFTATPNSADPRQANLDASASTDSDGDSLSFTWVFGDGNSTSTTNPVSTHTYANAGTYTITLTVYDTWGASNQSTAPFTAHLPPVASFKVVSELASGTNIQVEFTANASSGGDGTITSYAWQFGDATSTTVTTGYVFHNYPKATYDGKSVTVNLTVTNSFGFTNSTSQIVKVSSTALPPVAVFSVVIDNYTRTVNVDGSASYTPTGQAITSYNWTWGDGTWNNYSAPTATASHTYASDNTWTITLTVTNTLNAAGSGSKNAQVALVNAAPTAAFVASRSFMNVTVNASTTFDLNGNLAWFTWTWGDGSAAQTYPSSQVTAKHTYIVPGRYLITLVANDTTNLKGTATRYVSVANTTLDYSFYDFFNVPYGEWWDFRTGVYGDLPPNANCFNATSISDGVCSVKNAALPAAESYPYTDWYPAPFGSLFYQQPGNDPFIYAPYRFNAIGANVPGYNLSQPVFLPVFAPTVSAGKTLDFSWNMQYLDVATANAVTAAGCSGVAPRKSSGFDGFMLRSQIYITVDLQESKRLFGVPSTDTPAQAQTWWNGMVNPACSTAGTFEANLANWFATQGNGPYDIWNTFQFPYTPLYTNMTVPVVDPTTGVTRVYIDMAAWGTDALMARWFYWGAAPYSTNYLDSTKAKGWWGMELAWWEDFHFNGDLNGAAMNFSLKTVMDYHFQMGTLPGPDKCLRNQAGCTETSPSDDVPFWTWGPFLSDYVDSSKAHPYSELTRWGTQTYLHTTPGGSNYGLLGAYDYAPDSWPARSGEQWHFLFPVKMMFYNSSSAPIPANPQGSLPYWNNLPLGMDYVEYNTTPANYGVYNNTLWTWDVAGSGAWHSFPTGWPTGGGTGQYPAIPWGSITFIPFGAKTAVASPAAAAVTTSAATVSSPTWSTALSAVLSPSIAWFSGLAATPARLEALYRPA